MTGNLLSQETFGRRAAAPMVRATLDPPASQPTRLPQSPKIFGDPEFAAWSRARTATRWKIWGTCGLLVLGGPLSLLFPDGIGLWASAGLTLLGAGALWSRRRKPAADDPV